MDGTTDQAGLGSTRLEHAAFHPTDAALFQSELGDRQVLDALAAAVYVTDAAGRITYYNEAAAALWGHRPALGQAQWCGSWRLFWPDGRPLPHDQCPMAVTLREGRPARGLEAIAERPDGTRVPFVPYPTPLHDASGRLVGAVNMLIDISDRRDAERAAQQLSAIVESAEDAILAKDLDGVITSWNSGAERLFGYTPDEAIGRPITLLIPADRLDEEPEILRRIRAGERVEHFDTIRRRKDGSLVEISLTISPIRNAQGRIVGASKIARDITERRQAQEQQQLLLREMDHRVKNLFTVASSVVALSARSAGTVSDLTSAVQGRLSALARAHALTLSPASDLEPAAQRSTTLHALISAIGAPYDDGPEDVGARIAVTGPDVPITGRAMTGLALLLHEFATNAAKYGALSTPTGRVDVACSEQPDVFCLEWTERGGPPIGGQSTSEGFGSLLARLTVTSQLGGELSRDWRPEGLVIRLSVRRDRLTN
ncbi:PAS domain S-box protein [Phenylobacterium sp. LjRoot225]|uniref:PAS domain S-box protein n=1 Tax=Phenylobacterium sp. LjRoot225 TaxID=3342285 RepID=UPI003ED02489